MTDSEADPSSTDESEMDSFFCDEDFDFANVAVSEAEYYSALDTLAEFDFVLELTHSLCLNEVFLAIDPTFSGDIHVDMLPEGVKMQHVTEWDADSEDDRLCLELDTGPLMCLPENRDEYFPGEYDPEAMAALSIELSLFEETDEVHATVDDDDEVFIQTSFTEGLRSTFLFDDVTTFLGYRLHAIRLEHGTVTDASFEFSERRVWKRDDGYAAFQAEKVRSYRNALLDASDAVLLPCGHEAEPTIKQMTDIYTKHFAAFETVPVEGNACYEIPVVDAADAFLEVASWPEDLSPVDAGEGFSATAIGRGYLCHDCDVFYPFVDVDSVGSDLAPAESTEPETAVVTVGETEYPIAYVPIPARPIGYHDAFVDDAE